MKAFVFCLLSSLSCFAQPRPTVMEDVGKFNLPAQKIGPNDLIAVSVYSSFPLASI